MTDKAVSAVKPARVPVKERLQDLVTEYGAIALTIFFAIFLLTYLGFYLAITSGADVGDSAAGSTGTFVAAWLATKLTMPLRVAATLVLTPIAAAVLHRIKPKRATSSEPEGE